MNEEPIECPKSIGESELLNYLEGKGGRLFDCELWDKPLVHKENLDEIKSILEHCHIWPKAYFENINARKQYLRNKLLEFREQEEQGCYVASAVVCHFLMLIEFLEIQPKE